MILEFVYQMLATDPFVFILFSLLKCWLRKVGVNYISERKSTSTRKLVVVKNSNLLVLVYFFQ